ncbi:DUF2190 family protein [Thiococcus pfennigii]|uniref:DUF2190 family protein n=1 Tax=Thiococcus pfennigii TaxID=1057 RepID=UPI001904D1CD|nr:DUF2190 family protein [Thiococcus pfennigii]MBK1699751.1 hypothetical protein [Thiococcus pfennigii]
MANNYDRPGEVLDFVNGTGAAISSGAPIVFGRAQMGVALADIASGAEGSAQMRGVWSLAKNTSDAAVQGAPAWWDPTAEEVINAVATGAYFLGHFAEAAAAEATACLVCLAPSFRDEGPRLLTLAATGAQSLAAADFLSGDLTVLAPNTAAIAVTLPAVASVPVGAKLRVKKTTADAHAVTLDGAASEQVGGGATFGAIDAIDDTALFINTGAAWQLIDSAIA